MGNDLCQGNELPQRLEVSELPDFVPNDPSYHLFRGSTNRYSDLSVVSADNQSYIFTLKVEEHRELQVTLSVLNELAHRAMHPNYKLDIGRHILVDPMDPSFENTLVSVNNDLTGVQYSLRVKPFSSYNSGEFKKCVEEIWVHQKLTKKERGLFLTLDDAFVYGVNSDQQALVLLFERADSTLFNVGEYRKKANWPWSLP